MVWGVAQLLFPWHAEGSLIYASDGRTVIGSELIAQRFVSPRYFQPRPSAVDFKADAAGGSNLGTHNADLRTAVAARVQALEATAGQRVPLDLVTASGSGLDPDISLEAAFFRHSRRACSRPERRPGSSHDRKDDKPIGHDHRRSRASERAAAQSEAGQVRFFFNRYTFMIDKGSEV